MDVDTSSAAGPCKDLKERERVAWWAQCDRVRAEGQGRDRAAVSTYSSSYNEVVAYNGGWGRGGVGAVGDRRQVEGCQVRVAGAMVPVGDRSLVTSSTGWRGEVDRDLVSAKFDCICC